MNNKNNIQLIASDLDGTLLNHEKKIPFESVEVLKQAQKQGMAVVLSTGRHLIDTQAIAKQANLKAHFVSANGTQVYTAEGECLSEQFLTQSVVKDILNLSLKHPDLNVNLYSRSCWYIGKETAWLHKNTHLVHLDYKPINWKNPPLDQVLKIYFISTGRDKNSLLKLEQYIKETFSSQVNVCFSSPQSLEVMPLGLSKLSGLSLLASHLNIPLSKCVAFGDGMNDVEMLTGVGKGILMGSSSDRVKHAIPSASIIGTCEEQAVAQYIKLHVLK